MFLDAKGSHPKIIERLAALYNLWSLPLNRRKQRIELIIPFWVLGFYPYTDVCLHCTLSRRYFPESSEKKYHRQITWVGFKPMTLAILERCLTTEIAL